MLTYAHWKQFVAQQRDLVAEVPRTFQRLQSIPEVMRLARETRVGITPHDVVFTRGTLKLLHYRRTTPATYAEPVLFCYALVNRPYILDLQPGKSIVQHYLDRGHEVYMIDWGVPVDEDRHLSLEHYVCGSLRDTVSYILREHGLKQLHLLGYCMGGTFATLLTALEPERTRTLTLLASPIDFAGRESLLNVWAAHPHFDVDAFVDAHGNCPATFLQACFLYIKPVQNILEKKLGFYEHMTEREFLVNYFALERWVNDNIAVAGETFRAFVKQLYQQNQLVRGQMMLHGMRVDLSRVACPLLLLTARHDHLVAPASTEGIRPHVSSRDIQSITVEAGHVGLVVSGKAQKCVWPQATQWLAERSRAVSARA